MQGNTANISEKRLHISKRHASLDLEIKNLRELGIGITSNQLGLYTIEYNIPHVLRKAILELTNKFYNNKVKVYRKTAGLSYMKLSFFRMLDRDLFKSDLLKISDKIKYETHHEKESITKEEVARLFDEITGGWESEDDRIGVLATDSILEVSNNIQLGRDALSHLMKIEGQTKVYCVIVDIPIKYGQVQREKTKIDHYYEVIRREAVSKPSFICRVSNKFNEEIRKGFYFFSLEDANAVYQSAYDKLTPSFDYLKRTLKYDSLHIKNGKPGWVGTWSYTWEEVQQEGVGDRIQIKDLMKRFPSNDDFFGSTTMTSLFETELSEIEIGLTPSGLTYAQEMDLLLRRLNNDLNMWHLNRTSSRSKANASFRSISLHAMEEFEEDTRIFDDFRIRAEDCDGFFQERTTDAGAGITWIFDFIPLGDATQIVKLVDFINSNCTSIRAQKIGQSLQLNLIDAKKYFKIVTGYDFIPTEAEIASVTSDDAVRTLFENEESLHDLFIKIRMDDVEAKWTREHDGYEFIVINGAQVTFLSRRGSLDVISKVESYNLLEISKTFKSFGKEHKVKDQNMVVYDFYDLKEASAFYFMAVDHMDHPEDFQIEAPKPLSIIVIDNLEDARDYLRYLRGEFSSGEEESGYYSSKSLFEGFSSSDLDSKRVFELIIKKLGMDDTLFSIGSWKFNTKELEKTPGELQKAVNLCSKLRLCAEQSETFVCGLTRRYLDSYETCFVFTSERDRTILKIVADTLIGDFKVPSLIIDEYWAFKIDGLMFDTINLTNTFGTYEFNRIDLAKFYENKTGKLLTFTDDELGEIATGMLG